MLWNGLYPFHRRQAGHARASPAVERDWATVTADTDSSSHRWDAAGGCGADAGRPRDGRSASATVTAPDSSTPTTNLNCWRGTCNIRFCFLLFCWVGITRRHTRTHRQRQTDRESDRESQRVRDLPASELHSPLFHAQHKHKTRASPTINIGHGGK